ncbi:HalOD1 output domain-containing protein [Haladaptatus sp. DFWS20]|uniref:HalOD1 output domain-containing protein n=1 Tax=Haladaptatus sp. DFWS20 TaxID=3403467 RepID=UPI003EBA3E98
MDHSGEDEPSIDDRPSIQVINAIAEHEEATPTEIKPVLYDIIDPDALDSLFEETQHGDSRADGYVSFQYGTHEVTVYSDGRVEIVRGSSSEATESTGSGPSTSEPPSNDS